jgi:hypothetical protein
MLLSHRSPLTCAPKVCARAELTPTPVARLPLRQPAALAAQLQQAVKPVAVLPQVAEATLVATPAATANATGGARSTQPAPTPPAVGAGKTIAAVLPPRPVTARVQAAAAKSVTKLTVLSGEYALRIWCA